MICPVLDLVPNNFFVIWIALIIPAMFVVFSMTAVTFYWLYAKASFEKWQYKTNAVYPPVSLVREEILATARAISCTTLMPALAIYFRSSEWTHGYCPQDPDYITKSENAYHPIVQFMLIVGISDFFEFLYHWCGHYFDAGWAVHRHHHKYYNPTPFAVVADEWFDNIWRASPLFFFPMFFTLNIEILWYTFLVFFYCYGIYLHCGYEADWIVSAKNPVVNTSFQHYIHHATGTRKRPCHCGFFIKLWDYMAGCMYDGPECHAEAERAKGKRSRQEWEKIAANFPDYSLLWTSLSYWIDPVAYAKVKPVVMSLEGTTKMA